ncbi:DUF4349 domain-containing protein [Thermococcus paralvinellae]|uniref:DUF4349 domain-containing protein n=1 Tax=Thermococcus paralvinellae TaxID=582419 RepID=W0I8Y2_9EURY|nr:DUF4349 domain-containing protein [Thermococcus paralvinellae]AHF80915.1 Hypothetical protein TES1_1537 [Thermococcus paralvinellae]
MYKRNIRIVLLVVVIIVAGFVVSKIFQSGASFRVGNELKYQPSVYEEKGWGIEAERITYTQTMAYAPTYTRPTVTAATQASSGLANNEKPKGVVQRPKKDYYVVIQDESPEKVANEIKAEIYSLGGYVISENLDKSEERVVYYIEFRIPNTAENENKVGTLLEKYNVKSLRLDTQDVTSKYNQILAEIESLEAEKNKLLEFYNLSKDIDDLMRIESRISSINSRLNYLYFQKDYYEKVTDYITYHVTIESKEKPVFEIDLGFRKTIYQAVTILLMIIRGIIALLIIVSPFAVLYLVGRKLYKKYGGKPLKEVVETKEE